MVLPAPRLRIGTRGSKLALAQAEEARCRLAEAGGIEAKAIDIVVIATTGDLVRDRPLSEIGGKGLFTKEIEEALLAGSIDLAVHSMKDMPGHLPDGLVIGALLPRGDARDALLSPHAGAIEDLPRGAIVGSSSVRRSAQLLRRRPDVKLVPFRGNVDTRLRKLDEGQVQATFLACAGLNRLGLGHRITAPMPTEIMLPAVAQGAIGLEIRAGDMATHELIAAVNHTETETCIACERAFLAVLDGSCRTPLAGHATLAGDRLTFHCEALTPDGVHVFTAERRGPTADAARLGEDAAGEVKAKGGTLLTL
jgi:hydroxymethylbilane synthase